YAQAAKNAITAGFNRIKIHAVNDYLIDQFLQDVSNERTNEYGESIKNCARFVLEIVAAVDNTTGEDGAIIHLSPWNTFQVRISFLFIPYPTSMLIHDYH
ncbi:hypothetical protein M422DRAFT_177273, partial [Sphaerobolus stellatus SS14]